MWNKQKIKDFKIRKIPRKLFFFFFLTFKFQNEHCDMRSFQSNCDDDDTDLCNYISMAFLTLKFLCMFIQINFFSAD